MRRRLLLANSHVESGGGGTYDEIFGEIPPESTQFGWPLYITVPFQGLSEESTNRIYYKEPSDIVSKLWDWCIENKELIESTGFYQVYEAYPPELYVNGVRINTIQADAFIDSDTFDSFEPLLNNINSYSSILSDFSIEIIVYQ